ncbi:MAG: hypothetical protein OXC02_04930, partial [Rhodobacteraceae bacterium]|nr:hypothetical protein [Paracoccaceae bacterium]
ADKDSMQFESDLSLTILPAQCISLSCARSMPTYQRSSSVVVCSVGLLCPSTKLCRFLELMVCTTLAATSPAS